MTERRFEAAFLPSEAGGPEAALLTFVPPVTLYSGAKVPPESRFGVDVDELLPAGVHFGGELTRTPDEVTYVFQVAPEVLDSPGAFAPELLAAVGCAVLEQFED